jgi:hypothetical protein
MGGREKEDQFSQKREVAGVGAESPIIWCCLELRLSQRQWSKLARRLAGTRGKKVFRSSLAAGWSKLSQAAGGRGGIGDAMTRAARPPESVTYQNPALNARMFRLWDLQGVHAWETVTFVCWHFLDTPLRFILCSVLFTTDSSSRNVRFRTIAYFSMTALK